MGRRIADAEQLNPPDDNALLDEASFAVVQERAKVREIERSEEVKDEIGGVKILAIRVTMWCGLAIWFAFLATVFVAIFTIAIHVFILIPPNGWLSSEHLQVLTDGYKATAQALFPVVVLLNPWILHTLLRRLRE